MLRGEVVALWGTGRFVEKSDAALRGDEDLFAEAGVFAQHFAEGALGPAVAIDVGVIEKGEARFDRSHHGLARRLEIELDIAGDGETPATVGETARL